MSSSQAVAIRTIKVGNSNKMVVRPASPRRPEIQRSVAVSALKPQADFPTLLKRCYAGAEIVKASAAENINAANAALAGIYRLNIRGRLDPNARHILTTAYQQAGIKLSKATTEFTALVKLFFGQELPRATISRYATTLQFASDGKIKSTNFVEFLQENGGTAGCARLAAEQRKAAPDIVAAAAAIAVNLLKKRQANAPKLDIPKEMRIDKQGLVALLVKSKADGSYDVLGQRPMPDNALRLFAQVVTRPAGKAAPKRQ